MAHLHKTRCRCLGIVSACLGLDDDLIEWRNVVIANADSSVDCYLGNQESRAGEMI
jgi:hypothetical protein